MPPRGGDGTCLIRWAPDEPEPGCWDKARTADIGGRRALGLPYWGMGTTAIDRGVIPVAKGEPPTCAKEPVVELKKNTVTLSA